MKPGFYRIVLLGLALAIAWPAAVPAKDGEREVRETRLERDLREAREEQAERAERELREQREAAEDAARELEDAREDAEDDAADAAREAERDAEDAAEDAEDEARRAGEDGGGRRSRQRLRVERESSGVDRLRDEVLLIGGEAAGEAVRRAGFEVIAERRLESLRQSMLRIRVRDGQSVERAVRTLREAVPGARVAPNHVFRPSTAQPQADGPAARGGGAVASAASIGIIDTGADRTWPTLAPAIVSTKGFAPGGYVARAHGTAVARIAGARGARLAVADVFGLDQRNALAASAERIAAGIDWLNAQHVRVVNVSIEGPDNLVLQYVVEQAVAGGMAIVAAAGNGGPAARPAFPAAYPGVIAVTAVDERGQVYRRAARGAHVQFAARGVYREEGLLAGTSFAAPAVAARLAEHWQRHPSGTREQMLAALRGEALDKGAPGRDPVYGWGVLGEGNGADRPH